MAMERKYHSCRISRHHIIFTTSVIVTFIIVACAAIAFVKLAAEVREQDTLLFDRQVLQSINRHVIPFLDTVMPIATDAGGVIGVSALTILVVVLFLYKKMYARAWLIVLGVSGAAALNLILKALFARDRPDLWVQLVHEPGYSFPSGHTMLSAGFALACMVTLWHSRWRWWMISLGSIYMLFIGFSRLYLGVHYPTDVLAGWLVSAVWVLTVALLVFSSFGRQLFATVRRNT